MPQSIEHVAIVGCGFTGTSLLFQLIDRCPVRHITIFEASGEFGPGYAYRPDETPDYLINNTTDTMCLTRHSRRAFLDWLETKPEFEGVDPRGHLPRRIYGRFLQEVIEKNKIMAADKGIELSFLRHEAQSLERLDDGRLRIAWQDGEVVVDAAVLTTGRCPDRDSVHPPATAEAVYIPTQIMSPDMDELAPDATVHVLGASLSAYDVVNRLFAEHTGCRFERNADGVLQYHAGSNERRVVLCSRSGRLKAAQSRYPMTLNRRHFTKTVMREKGEAAGLDLSGVKALITAEAEAHGVRLDWPEIVDPYAGCEDVESVTSRAGEILGATIDAATDPTGRNFLVDLFADAQFEVWDAFAGRALSANAERAYRSDVETAAMVYAAPCPVPTAEKLLALLRAGRLSVVKGVRKIVLSDDQQSFIIEHEFGSDAARVLVNATGATYRDVTSPEQPGLLRGLAEQGVIRPYRRDGIAMPGAEVDMTSFRLNDADNIYLANMLLWGPGFFTSSAITMAMVAERIVDDLVERCQHQEERTTT